MALNDTVRDKMKGDQSFIERIKLYIPIYRGYKERNMRRDEDRAVRGELSRALQGSKTDLAEIQRGLVGKPDLMMDVERLRTKVDKYDIDVKKAVNGYSGFHDSVKILEDDLDRLVAWDAQLIEDIQLLRKAVEELLQVTDDGTVTKNNIRQVERCVDDMAEAYNQREAVMKGFQTTE